ncbi:TIGR02680 family protein [Streptomyces odonnellii]|uniref:TIGR02680 family protein n=1 Tax=Streptomyces odonnellii TaxID=1417980 RepID=UPI00062605FD|nr:TIGR02680 family protein [Streptomyces odonnellii]
MPSPTDRTPAPALQRILDGELPVPERDRFQQLRLGLIGMWEYEEQEFVSYRNGLILRGRNGAGKTKVMEVTSPLLLDALLTARRLDPFGSTARPMRDNLLHRGRSHRVGYSWCEYGRVTEDGGYEFVTIGIGIRGSTSAKGGLHKPWFFVTAKRVGQDFSLLNEQRQPHLRKQLAARLDPGDVFEDRRAYRTAVAERLFGFGVGKLAALVELLLVLRKPKLSENFNGEQLSRMLSNGLPPVSTALLDDLAVRFDQLARDRDDLEQQERHQLGMSTFLSVYSRYARRWTRNIAEQLAEADSQLAKAQQGSKNADEKAKRTGKALENGQEERRRFLEERDTFRIAVDELRTDPLMNQHELLRQLQEQAEEAEAKLPDLRQRLEEAESATAKAEGSAAEQSRLLEGAAAVLLDAEEQALTRAARTRIGDAHIELTSTIREDPAKAETALLGHVEARTNVLRRAVDLAQATQNAKTARDQADEALQKTLALCGTAKRNVDEGEKQLADQMAELRVKLVDWSERCQELRLSDLELSELQSLAATFGLPGATVLSQEVARLARPRGDLLARQASDLASQLRTLQEERDRTAALRLRVAQQTDPLPSAPTHERRDRSVAADGAPLWRLLDFAPDTDDRTRAGLEAALLGSGVLDAWVTPAGGLLNADTLDSLLPADREPVLGRSLADVLHAVDHEMVPSRVTTRILAAIALAPANSEQPMGDWVSTDGSWRIGPIHGRTTATQAAYIGAAARQAERLRRLQALDDQLLELDGRIVRINERQQRLTERQDDLLAECDEVADFDQPLRDCQVALSAARRVYEAHDKQCQLDKTALGERDTTWKEALAELEHYARQRSTGTQLEALASEQQALTEYKSSLGNLFRRLGDWSARAEQHTSAGTLLTTCREHQKLLGIDLDAAERDAKKKRRRHDVRRSVVGADVDDVLKRLAVAQAGLTKNTAKEDESLAALETAIKQDTLAQSARAQALDVVEQRKRALGERCGQYRELDRLGFLALVSAGGPPVDAPDAVAAAQALLRRLVDDPSDPSALDQARDEVDRARQALEDVLAGPDWKVRAGNEDRLVSVRLFHNGQHLTVADGLAIVEREVRERNRLLDASEHDLFTEVLLGQVGDHLRRRRARAKTLIGEMNRLLGLRRTASGHVMRLVWEPDPDKGEETREALATLDRQASRFLPDEAREHLIAFLGQQIAVAREAEGGVDWKSHLRIALDYRTWSRIRVQYKSGPQERWTDIDAGMHGKGSGGEKAVMLQLPLFAAAAAHYTGAARTAPRPVYLDEAFAGIDAEMRGECMGLLVELDLDFVMASHDEWGFYEEVPGVATYQLFRDPQTEGVLTTPIIWDGAERHLMLDPALLGGSGLDFDADDQLGDVEHADDGIDEDEDLDYEPETEVEPEDTDEDGTTYSRTRGLLEDMDLD